MAADIRYVTHTKWTGYTPTEVTYPNGRQVTSAYDALYRRTAITETAGGTPIASWQFFGPSRVATEVLGNGITCSMMNNAQSVSAIQPGGTYCGQ